MIAVKQQWVRPKNSTDPPVLKRVKPERVRLRLLAGRVEVVGQQSFTTMVAQLRVQQLLKRLLKPPQALQPPVVVARCQAAREPRS